MKRSTSRSTSSKFLYPKKKKKDKSHVAFSVDPNKISRHTFEKCPTTHTNNHKPCNLCNEATVRTHSQEFTALPFRPTQRKKKERR